MSPYFHFYPHYMVNSTNTSIKGPELIIFCFSDNLIILYMLSPNKTLLSLFSLIKIKELLIGKIYLYE